MVAPQQPAATYATVAEISAALAKSNSRARSRARQRQEESNGPHTDATAIGTYDENHTAQDLYYAVKMVGDILSHGSRIDFELNTGTHPPTNHPEKY